MNKIPQFCSEILSFTYICQSKTLIKFFFFLSDGSSMKKMSKKVVNAGQNLTLPHCLCTLSLSFEAVSCPVQSCWTWTPTTWLKPQVHIFYFYYLIHILGVIIQVLHSTLRQFFPKFHYKFGAVEQKFVKLSFSSISSVTTVTFYGISLS